MSHDNYISRTPGLLKSLDRALSLVRPILGTRYGDEADALIQASRARYRELIPQIPFLGDHNTLVDVFFLPATRHLAIYRAFRERGKSLEEVGQLVYEIGQAEMKALPSLARRAIGWVWFSRWFKKRLQWRAEQSRRQKYPGGYVVAYVEGDGKEFDYEFDYLQCATYHFFRQQGAAELVPYLCAIDKVASEAMGWGLRRTTTLADGGPRCDFRFKKHGRTCVPVPQSLSKAGK